jgi:hypothetical protein
MLDKKHVGKIQCGLAQDQWQRVSHAQRDKTTSSLATLDSEMLQLAQCS